METAGIPLSKPQLLCREIVGSESLVLDAFSRSSYEELPEAMVRCADTLRRASAQLSPPYDLEQIATVLGATVRYASLRHDGRVNHATGEIVVSGSRTNGRTRFTIAHELGHLVWRQVVDGLRQLEGWGRLLAQWQRTAFRERLCDQFAAELLMPASDLKRAAREESKQGMDLAKYLAHRFGTSITASVIRMIALGEPYIAVWWRYRDLPHKPKQLRVVWSRKPPGASAMFIPIHKSISSSSPVYETFRSGRAYSGRMSLPLGDLQENSYIVDTQLIGGGVLMLIDLQSCDSSVDRAQQLSLPLKA